MRFLAIADTHFGYEAGKTAVARKFVYDEMFNSFERVLDIARTEKVDCVLHGGDLFNRSKPRKKVIKRAYHLIENLLKDQIEFAIVPGNHERSILPNTLLSLILDLFLCLRHQLNQILNKLILLIFQNLS